MQIRLKQAFQVSATSAAALLQKHRLDIFLITDSNIYVNKNRQSCVNQVVLDSIAHEFIHGYVYVRKFKPRRGFLLSN